MLDYVRIEDEHGDIRIMLRAQSRDWHGRFAGGGGGRFGSGGGGVRDALAQAQSIEELNDAIAGEIQRISGQDTRVDLKGADLEVGGEIGEGVARGLEHSPSTRIAHLQTYGEGGSRPAGGAEGDGVERFAHARDGGISVDVRSAGDPSGLRADLKKQFDDGYLIERDPTGVAVHEFGHLAAKQARSRVADGGVETEAFEHSTMAAPPRVRRGDFVKEQISGYAASNNEELAAEAFADVVMNGSGASRLSHDIYDMVTRGVS